MNLADLLLSLPYRLVRGKSGRMQAIPFTGESAELLPVVLTSHLVLEHYIDTYLAEAFPNLNWANTQLTADAKLSLLKNLTLPEGPAWQPAAKSLNTLRNRFAHRLDYVPTQGDLEPMKQYVRAFDSALSSEPIARQIVTFVSSCASGFAHQMLIETMERQDPTD